MPLDSEFGALSTLVKIVFVDLLLSGDNAVVIALACRGLPPLQARQALLFGTGAAILLRVVLTALVTVLLYVPFLKLVGAAALLAIAIELAGSPGDADDETGDANPAQRLFAAIVMIVVADASMSLDNVVALSAVTHGNLLLLLFGLCLSIPLLTSGSLAMTALVNRYPALVTAGGVLLGWIAGDLAVSDPLIAGWVDREAFALAYATPLAAAIFVWAKSRMMVREPKRNAPAKPAKRMAVPAFSLPASGPSVAWTIHSESALTDRYGGIADRATGIAVPAAVSQSSGSRVKLFIYAVSAITVAIGIYLIGALGSAFTIIHQSTEHSRQTITDPSCPETVLSANRGVDPVTLNRLVAQCRTRAQANQ
ncbi:YjbE family putative metal transport protein [Azospirillum sp. TSO5]|uniref:YjbE family putative metal transport protein n=1 Tax=Azospirillum sp. TSO5 TaxID=716760 RepID=UPI001304B1DE|nr:YjbE family putative metal transport protein [Azospirillum sp. TSO5]